MEQKYFLRKIYFDNAVETRYVTQQEAYDGLLDVLIEELLLRHKSGTNNIKRVCWGVKEDHKEIIKEDIEI